MHGIRTIVWQKLSDIRTLLSCDMVYIICFIIMRYNSLQGRLWTINKKKNAEELSF